MKLVLVENYIRTRQALYVRGKLVREENEGDGGRSYLVDFPDIMALANVPLQVLEVDPRWLRRRKHFPKELARVVTL